MTGNQQERARPPRTGRRRVAKSHVLWAARPFAAKAGRCVAIKVVDDPHLQPRLRLYVAIETSEDLNWVPASQALTYLEAAAWAASGF